MKTVLICGKKKDPEVKAVATKLKELGHEVIYFNNKTKKHFTFFYDFDVNIYRVCYKSQVIQPHAIYWRTLYYDWFDCPNDRANNAEAFYELFIKAFPDARWVNNPKTFKEHIHKLPQLSKASLKALVPTTVVTNNITEAVEFWEACHKDIAVKPISGGTHTIRCTSKQSLVAHMIQHDQPQCLQEYIDGDNIRVYVVHEAYKARESIYGAIIHSDAPDFRAVSHTPIPIELSEEFKQQNADISYELGYFYTAIDWIKNGDTYIFLEANFAPCFVGFELDTGYPVTDSIVKTLLE